ncbi:hypothetical protein G6F22_019833 [Rhizopus arrhizus]|nr:hypothetical protein G6F22_019833 [Rhizopus arrhizus]
MHVAAFHRLAFGGDRAEHAAIAQQLQGVVLVVHAQVEQVAVALVQFGDRRYEPAVRPAPRPPVPAWAGRGAAGPLRRRWAGTVPGARPVPGRACPPAP